MSLLWPINKNKKLILFLTTLSILALAASFFYFKNGLQEKTTETLRPNVILISIDSLRADHVFAYGYGRQTTPNIDALAKEGILFRNYITQSYLTPISEMSLQSGTYPSTSGVIGFDTVLSDNILTLAQILEKYGYRSAAFGNSLEFSLFPALKDSFSRGFGLYQIDIEREKLPSQTAIFDFATVDSNTPFFLWLPLGSAHFPYGKFSEKFSDPLYAGPLKSKNLDWFNGVFPWIYENTLYEADGGKITKKMPLSQTDMQYIVDKYDGDILATDAWLGTFLKQLKSEGLDKNTIIILESEHGEDLGEHGYIQHYDIFDTTLKVPLIIKNPSLSRKNVVVENQIQSIDILPTILDFLDIPKAHQIEGNSLVPLLEKKEKINSNEYVFIQRTPLWERVMFISNFIDEKEVDLKEFLNSATKQIAFFYQKEIIQEIMGEAFLKKKDVAVRTRDWKLIYRQTNQFQEQYSWWNVLSGEKFGISLFELYDLRADPGETKNVIDQHPDVAADLKEKLMEFVQRTESNEKTPEIKKPIYDYF